MPANPSSQIFGVSVFAAHQREGARKAQPPPWKGESLAGPPKPPPTAEHQSL